MFWIGFPVLYPVCLRSLPKEETDETVLQSDLFVCLSVRKLNVGSESLVTQGVCVCVGGSNYGSVLLKIGLDLYREYQTAFYKFSQHCLPGGGSECIHGHCLFYITYIFHTFYVACCIIYIIIYGYFVNSAMWSRALLSCFHPLLKLTTQLTTARGTNRGIKCTCINFCLQCYVTEKELYQDPLQLYRDHFKDLTVFPCGLLTVLLPFTSLTAESPQAFTSTAIA